MPITHILLFTFFITQSLFLIGFSWSSDNITASNKMSTSKIEPTSISGITIKYFQEHFIIPLLCQCGLFIHKCVPKKSIVSKDVIFYLLWYNMIHWSSHICQKSSFLSFYSFLVKFSELHKGSDKVKLISVTNLNGVKNAITRVTYIVFE